MKKVWLWFLLLMFGSWTANGQGNFGEIVGKMFEKSDSDIPAFGAKVWVSHGSSEFPARVDEDGRFRILSIPTGNYFIEAIYMGDTLKEKIPVIVQTDGIANVGRVNILENVQIEDETVITAYKHPLINFGDVGQKRITSEDIMLSPVRNDPGQLIVSRNSDIKMDANGELMIRGSRAGDMVYFIDGIKTDGVKSVPSVAIGSVTTYSSAIPAKYGDTAGGVIIMETKSYHDLYRMRKMGLK